MTPAFLKNEVALIRLCLDRTRPKVYGDMASPLQAQLCPLPVCTEVYRLVALFGTSARRRALDPTDPRQAFRRIRRGGRRHPDLAEPEGSQLGHHPAADGDPSPA